MVSDGGSTKWLNGDWKYCVFWQEKIQLLATWYLHKLEVQLQFGNVSNLQQATKATNIIYLYIFVLVNRLFHNQNELFHNQNELFLNQGLFHNQNVLFFNHEVLFLNQRLFHN